MAEYSRVGDQFESSKNKLLKLANTRVEQYSDKSVADKLREVNIVFQKLKSYLLVSMRWEGKQREALEGELRKLQVSLDRALRGDK